MSTRLDDGEPQAGAPAPEPPDVDAEQEDPPQTDTDDDPPSAGDPASGPEGAAGSGADPGPPANSPAQPPPPSSDDSVRCGNAVLDPGELCDVSIESGEPGSCLESCAPTDACARPLLRAHTCWTECVCD